MTYKEWLLEKIHFYDQKRSFIFLIDYLMETQFVWSVANDDNRATDGIDLRYEYGKGAGWEGPCSVLEMMIALAQRIENNIMGEPGEEDQTYFWFWEMIKNLGLYTYDDSHFGYATVDYIVQNWLMRKFRADGIGGAFPLRYPAEDQRGVEIWFQMCNWLNENYKIV